MTNDLKLAMEHKRVMGLLMICLSVALQGLQAYTFLTFPVYNGVPAHEAIFTTGVATMGWGFADAAVRPFLNKAQAAQGGTK